MVRLLGKTTHSTPGMFSWYKNLIDNLVFPTSVCGVVFFLIAPFHGHCLFLLDNTFSEHVLEHNKTVV